jgi:transposase-like protein
VNCQLTNQKEQLSLLQFKAEIAACLCVQGGNQKQICHKYGLILKYRRRRSKRRSEMQVWFLPKK